MVKESEEVMAWDLTAETLPLRGLASKWEDGILVK